MESKNSIDWNMFYGETEQCFKEDFIKNSKTLIDLDDKNKILNQEQFNILSTFLENLKRENGLISEDKIDKKINSHVENYTDSKIMRNKTKNSKKKFKLGIINDYEIEVPELLTTKFTEKNGKIKCYLYSIQIVKKIKYKNVQNESGLPLQEQQVNTIVENSSENFKTFGILFPIKLSDYFPLKIVCSKQENKFSVEEVNIYYVKTINVEKEFFIKVLIFHYRLFSDLNNCKK